MFHVKEGKVHLSQLNIFRQERREKEERQKKAKEMSEDHDKRKKGTKLKSDQLWALEDIMIDEETEQDWLMRHNKSTFLDISLNYSVIHQQCVFNAIKKYDQFIVSCR